MCPGALQGTLVRTWGQASCHQDKKRETKGTLGLVTKAERKDNLEMFQQQVSPVLLTQCRRMRKTRQTRMRSRRRRRKQSLKVDILAAGQQWGDCSFSAEKNHIMSVSDHLMMVSYIMTTPRTSNENFGICL